MSPAHATIALALGGIPSAQQISYRDTTRLASDTATLNPVRTELAELTEQQRGHAGSQ